MTPGRPTGTTPFALVYEMDVVIPIKIGMPTARTTIQGQRDEKQELERQLDWVDEMLPEAPPTPSSISLSLVRHLCTWPLQPLFPLPSDEPRPSSPTSPLLTPLVASPYLWWLSEQQPDRFLPAQAEHEVLHRYLSVG
ncbi:hypothetical protein CK203_064928 [Vitis vinifera]|uniref:Uncharacterized protein n=1 Tax=Vitis vinifera TaxID=29760 RepID=A0A438FQ48_VITVI|nr:hypothetical protein CK203_064928 [Vitis vinifera]